MASATSIKTSNCQDHLQISSLVRAEVACTRKDEFENWLMSKVSRQSTMVSRSYGEKIIQYLRDQRDSSVQSIELKNKYSPAFRFQVKKRKFKLINVVSLGDILCLPIKDKSKESHSMLGEHRQVIFKEDMFGVIDSAHKNGDKHRGYKGTFKKISASYCNIPREIVHKYVSMCGYCQQSHACYIPTTIRRTKTPKVEKKRPIEPGFFSRCQVDIINLQHFPDVDGGYTYIGHFFDHHTKYNVLFPLQQCDSNTVAATLCQFVFGHFGLPSILHSNVGRKFVDELILWVMQFWSTDAKIFNGNPKKKNLNQYIEQRQKTILILIDTMKSKQPDFSNWSSLLPGIQYSLNTNSFEANTTPAFDIVFHRRPRVFHASNDTTIAEKEILKEEDVFLEGNAPSVKKPQEKQSFISNEQSSNEVTLSDIIPTVGNGSLIMSGVDGNMSATEVVSSILESQSNSESNNSSVSQNKPEQNITGGIICDLSSLRTVPIDVSQHFSLVSANIGDRGHTIQIPVVSIDESGDISEQIVLRSGQYESVVNETTNSFENESTDTLQLTNISEMNLSTANSTNNLVDNNNTPRHLDMSDGNESVHLELTNGNEGVRMELANGNEGVRMELTNGENTMEYESLNIVTDDDDNVINTADLT